MQKEIIGLVPLNKILNASIVNELYYYQEELYFLIGHTGSIRLIEIQQIFKYQDLDKKKYKNKQFLNLVV